MKRANDEIAVIVQIEHIEAVQNIDAILDVPGIDGVFVGPFDMSGSMDLPGQINHPQVQEAIKKVIKACEKRDIARCIYAHTAEACDGRIWSRATGSSVSAPTTSCSRAPRPSTSRPSRD